MHRRERVAIFRDRLSQVIERSGLSRSAFAERAGFDRSTLSQLLSEVNDRLPRAETIAAIAEQQSVSLDWLLGLTQEDQVGTNIVAQSLEISVGSSTSQDERLIRWHDEAVGTKVRYVPSTLPDHLKTEEIIAFEFEAQGGPVREKQVVQANSKLAYIRKPETDTEACSAYQSVEAFVRGEGIWRALPKEARKGQLEHMIELVDELYPTFRWFLFDGLERYAPAYTVFGPKRATTYIGNFYFVFNSTEHIRALSRHFDDLIRAAVVQPNEAKDFLAKLRQDLK